jgi:hypothetical protein
MIERIGVIFFRIFSLCAWYAHMICSLCYHMHCVCHFHLGNAFFNVNCTTNPINICVI